MAEFIGSTRLIVAILSIIPLVLGSIPGNIIPAESNSTQLLPSFVLEYGAGDCARFQ